MIEVMEGAWQVRAWEGGTTSCLRYGGGVAGEGLEGGGQPAVLHRIRGHILVYYSTIVYCTGCTATASSCQGLEQPSSLYCTVLYCRACYCLLPGSEQA